jgi:hypothetical protein
VDKSSNEGEYLYYKVKSYKEKKYSAFSIIAKGYREPDNIDVTFKNSDYLTNTITIKKLYGAYEYKIYRSLDNNKWKLIKTFKFDDEDEVDEKMIYKDTDLSYNKKYYYKVRAYNGVNHTDYIYKNLVTRRLKAPVVQTAGTIYHPTLTISKVDEATGYEIYHSLDNVNWTKEQKSTSRKFKKTYSEDDNHYYRVRAYKTINNKTYYSNFTYVNSEDFK